MLLSPAAASFDMFVDYAARGRAFKAGRRRGSPTERRQGSDPMSATLPPSRAPTSATARPPAKQPTERRLQRERHQPDYVILVAVVASPRSAS